MNTIADDIDLSSYLEAADDVSVQVKPASDYLTRLLEQFESKTDEERSPSMFTTKLRGKLEFRPGEVTCWAGYNGHRKSMFTGQVALDMLVQRQRVLIASFEMAPPLTLARMARQLTGAENPTRKQIAQLMEWSKGLFVFDHEGTISPERCNAVCRYFADELDGQHVFIDSMMMVCNSEEHLDEQKRFMTSIVRTAIETGLHIHLIAHCRKPSSAGEEKPPSKYEIRGSSSITDQAHNVVIVWADQTKKAMGVRDRMKPDALVTVEKQRNGKWEGRAQLWFDEPSLRFTDDQQDYVTPYAGFE